MKLAALAILFTLPLTASAERGAPKPKSATESTGQASSGADMAWHATPEIASAMRKVWGDVVGSMSVGAEAGFRVDSRDGVQSIVLNHFTNQAMKQKMDIIPGVTVAIYHVHPRSADPLPSAADRSLAEAWSVKVYTIHYTGLYVYDPATKTTGKLRERLDWLKN